jgi:hypothetical protein
LPEGPGPEGPGDRSSRPLPETSEASRGALPSVPTGDAHVDEDLAAARSIGHTSYVLKLVFRDGSAAAFKPRSTRLLGDRRYRGEIAAYRLASALGLDSVPLALPGGFSKAALEQACAAGPGCGAGVGRSVLVDPDGRVRGAVIPWIADYRVVALEEPRWRTRWEPWITSGAPVPDPERALAAEISTMIAFDCMTGNWDRWSGGNVARHGETGALLYVDNDGAFYDKPPAELVARQFALLHRVTRFSRRFVAALRALNESRLRSTFGDERPGDPLLPASIVAAVEARRRSVLAFVDERIAAAGERATLAFE